MRLVEDLACSKHMTADKTPDPFIHDLDLVQKLFFSNASGHDDISNFVEKEVKNIARRYNLCKYECIADFRTRNVKSKLSKLIRSSPCSTAECERGFSIMNNIVTDLRVPLTINHV